MTTNKVGTVALVIGDNEGEPVLVTAIADDQEIEILEAALNQGEENPLRIIHAFRLQQTREDEEFGDYVEEMLTKPGLKDDLRRHGLQWFQSRGKIEMYKKMEEDATKVIAEYAYEVYQADHSKTDFILAGPQAEVRIRIFHLPKSGVKQTAA